MEDTFISFILISCDELMFIHSSLSCPVFIWWLERMNETIVTPTPQFATSDVIGRTVELLWAGRLLSSPFTLLDQPGSNKPAFTLHLPAFLRERWGERERERERMNEWMNKCFIIRVRKQTDEQFFFIIRERERERKRMNERTDVLLLERDRKRMNNYY